MESLLGGINLEGKFDLVHKIEPGLKKDAGLIAYNQIAVELTRIAAENKLKPEEVVSMFKKIRSGILE
jgi:hypothetical protein